MKSLVSTCKLFRSALFPLFRCAAVIDLSQPWSYVEAPIPIDHRRMVRSLKVLMGSQLQKRKYDYAINLHLSNFADFSNLVEFHWAQHYRVPKEIYLVLRSYCSLRVLKIQNEYDKGPLALVGTLGLPPPQCALTMASIGEYDIMKDIFRHGSASHRTIAHLVILHAYLLQALDAEISFPSLVHIDICLARGEPYPTFLFKLLKSNPTLERITLCTRPANLSTNIYAEQLPELPHLKHFTSDAMSHSPFLSLAFGRRILDTLSLRGALLNREEVQRIHWKGLKVIDVALEDIVAENELIETIRSSGEMAWRKATIRIPLTLWTVNLGVRKTPVSTNFNDPIDFSQGLPNFLTAMANRTTHLTHLHIISSFNGGRGARRSTIQDTLPALHDVAKCLSAFPSWVEVTASSLMDMLFIRFVRKKTARELSQYLRASGRHYASEWPEIEGYSIVTEGWREGH
jgi:hypothetical protein